MSNFSAIQKTQKKCSREAKRPLSPITVPEAASAGPPSKRSRVFEDPDVLVLTERPDMAVLKWLQDHPGVPAGHSAGMAKYHDLAVQGEGGVSVTYRRQPSGRFIADERQFGKCSLLMKRAARSAAFGHRLVDVDAVNCHPSLLLEMAEGCAGIESKHYGLLARYIDNRELVFRSEGWPKATAKRFLNVTLFGGSVETFLEEELEKDDGWLGTEAEVPVFWGALRKELKALSKLVWRRAVPDAQKDSIEEWVGSDEWRRRHPGKTPHIGTYMSNVLQTRETDIIVPAIRELQAQGIVVESYQYDGFQCPKEHLGVLEEWIVGRNARSGRVRFAIKPFGAALERVPEPEFQCYKSGLFVWSSRELWVAPKPDKSGKVTAEADNDALAATARACKDKRAALKKLFETYAVKCHTPPGILWMPEGIDSPDKKVRSFASCKNGLFDNLKVPVLRDGEIIEAPLFAWWLRQTDICEHTAAIFAPPPLPIHPNHYNLFRGFKIEKTPPPAEWDPRLVVDHLGHMSEGNADIMLDLLAHRVQRPGERTGLGLVIVGPQGSGKTNFMSLLAKAFMDEDYVLITEKAEQITGKFPQIGGKLLLVWEEAESSDTCGAASKLKHLITVESEYVEAKCVNAIRMPMCFLPIVFANELDQKTVSIENSDRRYVVFRMDDKHYKNDPSYFSRLYGAMEDRTYMRGFYDCLKARDISKYRNGRDWAAARPLTSTYRNIQEANRKPLDRWFDEIAECLRKKQGFVDYGSHGEVLEKAFQHGHPVTSAELRKAYAAWSDDNGFQFSGNVQSFGTKLASLATGCAGSAQAWIKKAASKHHNNNRYEFDAPMLILTRLGEAVSGDIRAHCQ